MPGEQRTIPCYRECLKWAEGEISRHEKQTARLEAELLLADVLARDRSHLFAWPELRPTPEAFSRFSRMVSRRASGEPLAYITGHREFWSLKLEVTVDTLIPRAETETLVQQALQKIPESKPCRVADLGTGSGAIAAAIASERPLTAVVATDISDAALLVAERNFRKHNLTNIEIHQGEWCRALAPQERFHLILSNPPYVSEVDPHLKTGDLPWEPLSALTAGPDGLSAIRQITTESPALLRPGGWLLMEHGFDQGVQVREILAQAGFLKIATWNDLEGRERVSGGQRPGT